MIDNLHSGTTSQCIISWDLPAREESMYKRQLIQYGIFFIRFSVSKVIRELCPLFALLFVIALELLANMIWKDKKIIGININRMRIENEMFCRWCTNNNYAITKLYMVVDQNQRFWLTFWTKNITVTVEEVNCD